MGYTCRAACAWLATVDTAADNAAPPQCADEGERDEREDGEDDEIHVDHEQRHVGNHHDDGRVYVNPGVGVLQEQRLEMRHRKIKNNVGERAQRPDDHRNYSHDVGMVPVLVVDRPLEMIPPANSENRRRLV